MFLTLEMGKVLSIRDELGFAGQWTVKMSSPDVLDNTALHDLVQNLEVAGPGWHYFGSQEPFCNLSNAHQILHIIPYP